MSDALSPILQWINAHPELAGLATFGISTAESVAIIGTIIPGTVMMTAIGTLAGAGIIPLWQTLIWAILGAIVGDGISYWLGRHFNERLPYLWPFRKYPALLENGETFFRRYGSMSVFIGRFVGPVRALVPLVAGMLGMAPIRFYVANILSAIGWAPAYMLPGILLGAASLELPPDVAMHVIFMLLMTVFLIMFAVWLIQRLLKLISRQIDQCLTWIWNRLSYSPYFKSITQLLKHHNPKKAYGQLILTFYFILASTAFLSLWLYISVNGSHDITINTVLFHFFRSIRTPNLDNMMLSITFLGEKRVLIPVVVILFSWLAFKKHWYTAWHVLALGILAAGGVFVLKNLAHSPRPWGLLHAPENYSFPSGHTTLTMAFYLGITFLLLQLSKIKYRQFFYYFIGFYILLVSFSRLYLGVHWFTDILGGWLLGLAVFIFVAISYNRRSEKNLKAKDILLIVLISLTFSYSINVYHTFTRLKESYTAVDWPIHTITLNSWWYQQGKHLPFYRVNRFGLSTQILNLQWLDDLTAIQTILLANGWQIPPPNDWVSVLHRVSDVNSAEHLPLVSPIYLDKKPSLVLIKRVNGDKKLFVIRLWDSRVVIQDSAKPLWVGSVEIVSRTYSWLFKRRQNAIALTPPLLFTNIPANYDIKEVTVHLNKSFRPQAQYMLLIKPKERER
ncbi:MAG TPA: phosphatase PAP2 family protein [Gammaproteobacteria bacterium]|nr:phosphatase PAP2 family protein [Gammaproteobacteria bacterium]